MNNDNSAVAEPTQTEETSNESSVPLTSKEDTTAAESVESVAPDTATYSAPASETAKTKDSFASTTPNSSSEVVASSAEEVQSTTSESTAPLSSASAVPSDSSNQIQSVTSVAPEEPTKSLADLISGDGTNKVWISGDLAGQSFDCEGPIELSVKLTKPIWPFVTIEPNTHFERQRFNYSTGTWEALDKASVGQQVTDLAKKVKELSQPNAEVTNFNKQTMKALVTLTSEVQGLSKKIDEKMGGTD